MSEELKAPVHRQVRAREVSECVEELVARPREPAPRESVQLPRPPPLLEMPLVRDVRQLSERVERPTPGRVPLYQKDVPASALP